jgi:TrmH family RNA methyltransferase
MDEKTLITSAGNQIIKLCRSLHLKKNRDETGLFLVEGIHHVGAAIEAGWEISSLVYSPELLSSSFGNQLVIDQQAQGIKCNQVVPQLFKSISEKENPQGILAVVHQKKPILDDLDGNSFNWGIAAIAPQDPGNVGTILRTIDSAGADGLFLLNGGVDPYHLSSIRASMGAIFWKPVIQTSFDEFLAWARMNKFTIVGTSAHAQQGYKTLSFVERPSILILGSEQKGMAKNEMDACDYVVSIPMVGHSSSLNISVAAGILIYEMLK